MATRQLYALVNYAQNKIDQESFDIDPNVPTAENFKWVPVIVEPPEPYDPKLAMAEGPQDEILQDKVRRYWVIRVKTESEIDNDKRLVIADINPAIVVALCDLYNSVHSTSLTVEDYKTYLKGLL
jgi:hypothetical protein